MAEKIRSGSVVGTKKPGEYPPEIRNQAVELFFSSRDDCKTRMECAKHIANLLGIGCGDTVLGWVRKVERSGQQNVATALSKGDELKRLRRENAELKRANGILKAASAFFAA
ncbi:MAG: hypothetical protein LBG68_02180 [Coriobacteriales bacterium]|jgi:transposase|nr:hypothetical protein [Coriobacteriales bacterium]